MRKYSVQIVNGIVIDFLKIRCSTFSVRRRSRPYQNPESLRALPMAFLPLYGINDSVSIKKWIVDVTLSRPQLGEIQVEIDVSSSIHDIQLIAID